MAFDLLINGVLSLAALFALIRTVLRVPFPEKWPWFLGLGLISTWGVVNTLYWFGGKFVVLLVALYPLQATLETTGALALAIAAYSSLHAAKISPQWYALPTGSAPLAMAAQYLPTHIVQTIVLGTAVVYMLGGKATGSPSSKFVLPLILILAPTIARQVNVPFPVLSADNVQSLCLAAAAVILSFLATGDGVSVGKVKLK